MIKKVGAIRYFAKWAMQILGVVAGLCIVTTASATSDSFCGEPTVDSTIDTGLYIWKDCPANGAREQWYIKAASGGGSTPLRYTGSVESSWKILSLQGVGNTLEDGDVIVMDTIRKLRYELGVVNNGIDQIAFTIHKNSPSSTLTIGSDSPSQVFAGPNKVAVSSPLNLDEGLLPELSIDDVTASESDGELKFTISLSEPPGVGNTVTVDFETVSGTATSPADFGRKNWHRSFTGNQTKKTVTLDLVDDCTYEPLETFTVKLSNPVGATIADDTGEGTITGSDYTDEKLRDFGYLSVALYSNGGGQTAKPNDGVDDTVAIQAAIDDAIDSSMNVYFPSGEWQVSDTLYAAMKVDEIGGKWKQLDRREATSIVGCGSKRPKIKLITANNSFNNPDSNVSRKPVLWVYAQARTNKNPITNSFVGEIVPGPKATRKLDAMNHQSNISFNQVIKGIDFDLTAANTKGAIAIRHPGSQGSSISDVKVELGVEENSSYSAFDNPPGQGGGLYNTEVIGGQYAVSTNRDARFPVIVGAKFIDQSKAAIQLELQNSLVVAGFYIKSRFDGANGVEIGAKGKTSAPFNNVSMVDGKFRFDGNGSVAIKNIRGTTKVKGTNETITDDSRFDKSIYLNNVYFDESESEFNVYNVLENEVLGNITRYYGDHVALPSLVADHYVYGGLKTEILNNGITAVGPNVAFGSIADHNGDSPSVEELLAKHIWDDSFPNFQDDDVVNASTYNITPDRVDVTDDLQQLINDHQKIFLPAGNYNVTKTIQLRKDTVLLGAGKTTTSIRATGDWAIGTPIIATSNLTDQQALQATTTLAHIMLRSRGEGVNIVRANSFIDWTTGSNSVVRDTMIGIDDYHGPAVSGETISNRPAITIRDTGGGKWYGLFGEWSRLRFNTVDEDYRALLVSNTRNFSQQLDIYGLNIERSQSKPQSEFNNAANANVYSLKAEASFETVTAAGITLDEAGDPLHIVNSSDVNIVGVTGNARPTENLVKVINSDDIRLLNVAPVRPIDTFNAINVDDTKTTSGSNVGFLLPQ